MDKKKIFKFYVFAFVFQKWAWMKNKKAFWSKRQLSHKEAALET